MALVGRCSLALGWALFSGQDLLLAMPIAMLLVWQTARLMGFQHQLTERISYFFESIQNDDFSQNFELRDRSTVVRRPHENRRLMNDYRQRVKTNAQQQEHDLRALIEHVGGQAFQPNTKKNWCCARTRT